MSYPRFFSISTAGILRHYNQDYLIHETRTDFIGSNGIGKSMIADFIQILFIPYRNLIKFGTEGINNSRLLSKLPYQVNEAYICLNIEVDKNRFIAIGTCISQSERRGPTPFLILNDADTHKKLHELSYSEEHIPLHSHYIDEKRQIVDLKEVARHFSNNYKLYLTTYRTREKKNEFFTFLYNQEILPINLSIEDNLKAFAKVIQSFSRAKSLNVNNSKSLKAFLFEDESTYDKAFRKNKEDLQTLLLDYKRLDEDIQALEQKQSALHALKELEEIFKRAEKIFFNIDYKFAVKAMDRAREKYEKAKQELDHTRDEIERLKKREPRIDKLLKICEAQIHRYKTAIDALRKYEEEYTALRRIQKEISELTEANILDLDENISIDQEDNIININQLDHEEILHRIAKFKPVYHCYGSFAEMESQYNHQYKTIEKHKQDLNEEIKQLQKWMVLFSSDKGLLAQVIERGDNLSEEQEAALFHLLDVYWQKPDVIEEGIRYTDTLQILDIDNIDIDEQNNGFWLKLGQLREFLPKRKEQLLNTPETFKIVLKNRLNSFKKLLQTANMKLNELEQFQFGQASSVSYLNLDPALRDPTLFFNLKQTAVIIQKLDDKIELLNSQKAIKETALRELEKQIPFSVRTENIENQRLDKERGLENKNDRYQKILQTKNREADRHILLSNKIFSNQIEKYDRDKKSYQDSQLTYQEKEKIRLRLQIQIEIDEEESKSISIKTVNKLRQNLDDAIANYRDRYRDISNSFQETKNAGNPEINEQINDKLYEFGMLEHVLLGPEIKYIDNLPDVLRDSNRQREKIARSIHASMLRIFSDTKETFGNHHSVIRALNSFFTDRKISGKYAFHVNFTKRSDVDIAWIDGLNSRLLNVYQKGELPFGESVENFVEEFFRQVSGYKKNIDVYRLLDPKTYFDLSVSLRDDNGKDYSGSTGETYSAIVLLGIGRLSIVQKTERKGLRFIILEETANLDQTNFNHFPEIAREFGYQIITMTPQPYGSDSEEGWYLYHLLPSRDYDDINSEPLGYFKTNRDHKNLKTYLRALEKTQ